jgi:hypothetical protein
VNLYEPIPLGYLIITPIVVFTLWAIGMWYIKKESSKYNKGGEEK